MSHRFCRAPCPAAAPTIVRNVISAVLAVCASTASVPARAESANTTLAVHLNESGSELYSAGQYSAALANFERAYILARDPNLLFNIAGCQEQLGNRAQAIDYYTRFLAESGTDPDGRRRASEALRALERSAPPPPPPPQSVWDDPALPWLALGAGVFLVGTGGSLYLDGAADHREMRVAPTRVNDASGSLSDAEVRSLDDAGDTKKLIGGISMGLGSALIAAHVGLRVWQYSEEQGASSSAGAQGPSATLELSPNGCTLSGTF